MDKTITNVKSKKSFEWWTPLHIIEAARAVLNGIELDPASCEAANQIVRASRIYTLADNGLAQSWRARSIWLNPPYCGQQALWVKRLIAEYDAGNVEQAILLVSAATDTAWCQSLLESYPCCMVKGRINFRSPDGTNSGATFGNLLAYCGPNKDRFIEIFSRFGVVMGNLSMPATKQMSLFDVAD